jgi:hypothetical protein
VESEVFAYALNLWTLCFVKIDDVPLLSSASVVTEDSNCLTFFVFATLDIKNLRALPVDELVVLIFENLPPS